MKPVYGKCMYNRNTKHKSDTIQETYGEPTTSPFDLTTFKLYPHIFALMQRLGDAARAFAARARPV